MTRDSARWVAEKMTWRAWPEHHLTCSCGELIEASSDIGLLHATRGHLLNRH